MIYDINIHRPSSDYPYDATLLLYMYTSIRGKWNYMALIKLTFLKSMLTLINEASRMWPGPFILLNLLVVRLWHKFFASPIFLTC